MKDTKKRILKASQELFSKFGYKKVSVDEIVYNANLAKGTFYIYFSSKESLYRELIEINIKTLIAPKLIEYLKNEKDLQILMYKKNILGLHMINKNTLLKELFLHNPNYASEQMNYKRIEALNKDVSISILKRIKTEIRSDLSFSSITKISAWIFQIMLNIKKEDENYWKLVHDLTKFYVDGLMKKPKPWNEKKCKKIIKEIQSKA